MREITTSFSGGWAEGSQMKQRCPSVSVTTGGGITSNSHIQIYIQCHVYSCSKKEICKTNQMLPF